MVRPVLLDLFCGAGGASVGYHRAGWDVVGVDNRPQPGYPYEFILADAMEVPLAGYDAIHASPPCQGYSASVYSRSSPHAGTLGKDEPRLISDVRARLVDAGVPYVIENVFGARYELRGRAVFLCGTMFGLPIQRHRIFETSWPWDAFATPRHGRCAGVGVAYARTRGWDTRDMSVTGKGRRAGTLGRWMEVMGWPEYTGSQHGMREALPPAYTEWLGGRMLAGVDL